MSANYNCDVFSGSDYTVYSFIAVASHLNKLQIVRINLYKIVSCL